jgi:hypothetical protein
MVRIDRDRFRGETVVRRTAGMAAVACLCLAPQAGAAELPPAEKVFERYAEALGGAAVDQVRSMANEFDFAMPDERLLTTGREYYVRPDRHYLSIALASSGAPDFESGAIGGVAWKRNPTGLQEGEEKRQFLRNVPINSYADWRKYFAKAETTAEEEVNGTTCYKVVLTPTEGETLTAYFDATTGLLAQEEIREPVMGFTIVTKYSDYRQVGGIQWPYHIEQRGGPGFTVDFTSVRINVDDIPEGQFDVPEELKAQAPTQ